MANFPHHRKTRIDALQEQIDQLAAQLGHKQSEIAHEAPLSSATPSTLPPDSPPVYHPREGSGPGDEASGEPVLGGLVGFREADQLLDKFRTQKMPQFPFVMVAADMDIESLRQRSPFLLLCIVTVCMEHKPLLQHKLEALVRETAATRLIVKSERNLDLLLGLLVHCAWFHYHWRTTHIHKYMLLEMAHMVVVDLGIDKDENIRMQPIPQEGADTQRHHQNPTEQRALLGCYHLCCTSTLFRRQVTMRHTKWIQQCVEDLARKPEYPSDVLLGEYIISNNFMRRTQCVFDEDVCLCSYHPRDASWEQIVESIERQERQTDEQLSRLSQSDNWALRLELTALTTVTLGQAVQRRMDVFRLREINRLQFLTASAHRVLATYIQIPASVAVHLPASSYYTIWYVMLVLAKVSLLFGNYNHPTPDIDSRRVHEDVLATMRKIDTLSLGDDIWSNCRVISMVAWLEKQKKEAQRQCSISHVVQHSNEGYGPARPSVSWQSPPPPAPIIFETQPHWAPAQLPVQPEPTVYLESLMHNDWDTGMWRQTLEAFTMFGPPTPQSQMGIQSPVVI
ncbi:hypothetical protein BO78DRAFT_321610 [Aspergillus sclerotiicarbonarius CBS 121057]|uniref:Transcription factor domain-containing protein n=1 Tax=Aspergillus sclerotiicarbonarius (strain CBS 121057 / IBT 28362) TaxID=1448318 RepID=A0A319E1T9_ASPSB|nr:hypothetical protein BO78DRAFT_321610 [Aspergillus sclerotiicarbonarius CBS 121057]